MFDYSFAGAIVRTPGGYAQFLQYKSGKVLVIFDYETQPVEYDGDEVFLV